MKDLLNTVKGFAQNSSISISVDKEDALPAVFFVLGFGYLIINRYLSHQEKNDNNPESVSSSSPIRVVDIERSEE